MAKDSAFPAKPKPLIDESGQYEIIPAVDVFMCKALDPRDGTDDAEQIAKFGPVWRILYSDLTYDVAISRARMLQEEGTPIDRIQFQYAEKDVLRAIRTRKFRVRLREVETTGG